jgi:hypothetical protein
VVVYNSAFISKSWFVVATCKEKEINSEFMHLLKEAKDFKVSARSSSSTREKETEIGLYQNQPGD